MDEGAAEERDASSPANENAPLRTFELPTSPSNEPKAPPPFEGGDADDAAGRARPKSGPPATPERPPGLPQSTASPSSAAHSPASLFAAAGRFRDAMRENPTQDARRLAARLGIPRRRLYDILAVSESAGLVRRSARAVTWVQGDRDANEMEKIRRKRDRTVRKLREATAECELLDRWIAKLDASGRGLAMPTDDVVEALYEPSDGTSPLSIRRDERSSEWVPEDKLIAVHMPRGSQIRASCDGDRRYALKISAPDGPRRNGGPFEVFHLPTYVDDSHAFSRGARPALRDPLLLSVGGLERHSLFQGGCVDEDVAADWFD